MKKSILLFAVLLVSTAWAATLQILTVDQMTATASAIVQGKIVASHADWINGKGSSIYTS